MVVTGVIDGMSMEEEEEAMVVGREDVMSRGMVVEGGMSRGGEAAVAR